MAWFDLSVELLALILQLPDGAEITRIKPSEQNEGALTIVVNGGTLPAVMEGTRIPEIIPTGSMVDGRLVIQWGASPSGFMESE